MSGQNASAVALRGSHSLAPQGDGSQVKRSRSRDASLRSRHCEERKRRSNPGRRLRLDCFAPLRCARNDSFSRCVSAPELCHASILNRHHRLNSVLHAKLQHTNAGGSTCKRRFGKDDGRERTKEKFGGETPTDARSSSAAPCGCGRRPHPHPPPLAGEGMGGGSTSIGVPPRFSSQGVFHLKGLSLRPCFLGRGGDTFCVSL